MIITEHFSILGREYIRTESSEDRYVERDGMKFEVAYDPAEFGRTYNEGDVIVREPGAEEILDILMGDME